MSISELIDICGHCIEPKPLTHVWTNRAGMEVRVCADCSRYLCNLTLEDLCKPSPYPSRVVGHCTPPGLEEIERRLR